MIQMEMKFYSVERPWQFPLVMTIFTDIKATSIPQDTCTSKVGSRGDYRLKNAL
jgi:hypothetical protein